MLQAGTAVLIGSMLPMPQSALAADAEPPKLTGLTVEQMRDRIKTDFQTKQYYTTGNFSPELFTDDCLFVDPTVQVRGWRFYQKAVRLLFDADTSRTDIRSIDIVDDRTIALKWRQEGRIKPWFNAEIKPYCGETTYRLNDDGLIFEHLETWDAPAYDVFLSVFNKNFGTPPCPPVEISVV